MARQVVINQAQVDEVKRLLASIGSLSKTALKRSVNRTVTGVKTQVGKELRAVTTLKSAYIKSCISSNLEVDTALGVTGKITINSGANRGKPSYWTRVAQYQYSPLKKGGVNVKVYKNGSAVRFKHWFVLNITNKSSDGTETTHKGVFKAALDASGKRLKTRTGKSKVIEVVGTAVTQVYLNQPGLSERVETDAGNRLVTEVTRQVNYILTQQQAAP